MTQHEQNDEQPASDEATTNDQWPGKFVRNTWKAINVIAAILTLVVLIAAVWLPPEIGRGGTSSERNWQWAAVLVFLGSLVAISKKVNLSLLYLAFACAFFFVNCASNFHWQGG